MSVTRTPRGWQAFVGTAVLMASLLAALPLTATAGTRFAPDGVTLMGPTSQSTATDPSNDLPFETIDQGAFSNEEERLSWLLRSDAEWEEFWSRAYTGREPRPPLPLVDFAQDMVLVVSGRNQPARGSSLTIASITNTAGMLRVRTQERMDGPNCLSSMAVTQPYVIVSLPRLNQSGLAFDLSSRTVDCEVEPSSPSN
jgi:hypothetical protein